jgi:hypothetical protein
MIYLEGLSVLGPGMPDWNAAACLRGEQPFAVADVACLRCWRCLPPSVAVWQRGETGHGHRLCRRGGCRCRCRPAGQYLQLHRWRLRQLSQPAGSAGFGRAADFPTRFHNSVHNAPAGYWGIATGCTAASTSLCAYDATFAAALIETATQVQASGQAAVLVAFDTAYPQPLYRQRPIPYPMGVGMVLSARRTAIQQGRLATVALPMKLPAPWPMPGWNSCANHSCGTQPALAAIAGQRPARQVVLEYLDDCQSGGDGERMMDRQAIAARIPHQGSMCLLDTVLRWDAEEILCQTGSHLLADNPLRAAGRLGVANAIEYAAQAMAVHGALLAGDAARPRPVIWPACAKPAGIASGWMS